MCPSVQDGKGVPIATAVYLLLPGYVLCTIAQSQTLASHSRQHARWFGVARIYARMTCLVCRSHAARRMRMHRHGEAASDSDSDSKCVVCGVWCALRGVVCG
jgi:hypothetical protein